MRKTAVIAALLSFLVCLLAAGVIGLCAGIGIVKGVIDNAPDIDSSIRQKRRRTPFWKKKSGFMPERKSFINIFIRRIG